MPEENNQVIGNIETVEANGHIGIQSTDSPWALDFYFADVYDDKAVKRFIQSTERLIRTSREYKAYIELLRTNIFALNHDSIMSNITTADVDLEFHHYPFTLYDIIEIVMLKHVINEEKFTSFSLAKEIMELHFHHYIGLVPLTRTNHELAHSGNLFLSKKQIFGDYRLFMDMYESGITNDMRSKVEKMENLSEAGIPSDFKGMFK